MPCPGLRRCFNGKFGFLRENGLTTAHRYILDEHEEPAEQDTSGNSIARSSFSEESKA